MNILKDIGCNDDTTLEPRLQEYLKKKALYKDNNIIPQVPLEKEFQIEDHDLITIRRFMDGDKNINHSKRHLINNIKQKTKPKFEYGQTRHVTVYKQPKNYGMFAGEDKHYDCDIDTKMPLFLDARDLSFDKKTIDDSNLKLSLPSRMLYNNKKFVEMNNLPVSKTPLPNYNRSIIAENTRSKNKQKRQYSRDIM